MSRRDEDLHATGSTLQILPGWTRVYRTALVRMHTYWDGVEWEIAIHFNGWDPTAMSSDMFNRETVHDVAMLMKQWTSDTHDFTGEADPPAAKSDSCQRVAV